MTKAAVARSRWGQFLALRVDRASSVPIFRQIYLGIRDAVTTGRLSPGSQLPATRDLADRLDVSRTSVLSAYEQLRAEGYVDGKLGAGTFVSFDIEGRVDATPVDKASACPVAGPRALSALGRRYRTIGDRLPALQDIAFNTGFCSPDALTMDRWRQISTRQLARNDLNHFRYSDTRGLTPLREQIAEYLRAARLVNCEADRILVTSGTQQAVDLSFRVLVDAGDPVWLENPGYPATRDAVRALGAKVVPVPVDSAGLNVSAGIARSPGARAAYVTPSHQFPTGTVMSMARRLELLDWAQRTGSWIIEDDYDSEFRYSGQPLASLQGLDRHERVIYIGTFSKVLFPGLRLGFIVLPRDLVAAFQGARLMTDRHPPTLQQTVLADFMRDGFLTGHIRRTRRRYRAARDLVAGELRRRAGSSCDIHLPDCGMQLVCYLPQGLSDVAVAEQAARRGVLVRPLSSMFIGKARRSGLVLGFTGHEPQKLRRAAAVLGQVLSDWRG